MNLPTKFHRNRHCINGALDRTDRHTDKHIDGKSDKGRLKKKKKFFFRLYRLPNRHTDKHIDGKSDNKGRSKKNFFFFFSTLSTTQQTDTPITNIVVTY